MFDFFHTPSIPGLYIFLPNGTDANSWQVWHKPPGFTMATIYAIGPGGGGGSGRNAVVGTFRGGGAGGGSGGLSRLTIPLFLLPKTIHIRVTRGGSGGASITVSGGTATSVNNGNTAFAPSATLVGAYPSTTAQYLFLTANAGSGGFSGSSTSSNIAGASGGSISSISAAPLGSLGSTLFIAGNQGGIGSASGTSNISQGSNSQIYGGAGGAGINSTAGIISNPGGAILTAALTNVFIACPGGPSVSTAQAQTNNGGNGFSWSTVFPLKIYGATGGSSLDPDSSIPANTAIGGSGGYGSAPGTGGGGGGGSDGPSGAGGDGGPGCVIIQCW